MMPSRRWRPKLPSRGEWALLGATLLLAGAAGEVAARLTLSSRPPLPSYVGEWDTPPSRNMLADPYIGWRHYPYHEIEQVKDGHRNLVRSNAQGFRGNRDFDPPPPVMVALVGDSFTWGSGVEYEQTFGHLLEAELAGPKVFNFAMPGFGIDQMWMAARHYALPRHPHLLVVAFIDTDFDRSLTAYREGRYNKPRFLLRDGRLVPEPKPNAVFLALERGPSELVRLALSKAYAWRYLPPDERWALNIAILEAIADEARQNGVPVVFLRLPSKAGPRSCLTDRANPCGRDYDRLDRFFDGSGLSFIDLAVPDERVPSDMYLEYDPHLSPNGHRYVAHALAEWMAAHTPGLMAAGRARAEPDP